MARRSPLWNGLATQTGAQVSVKDAGYNSAIPASGSVSFGFNGTWLDRSGTTTPASGTDSYLGLARLHRRRPLEAAATS